MCVCVCVCGLTAAAHSLPVTDCSQVVISFDAARKLDSHLHRIGRTARAGASGLAITMVEDGDRQLLKEVGHPSCTGARLVFSEKRKMYGQVS